MEIIDKIVDFSKCKNCEYYKEEESETPCHECLNNPANPNSQTPLYFKESSKNS